MAIDKFPYIFKKFVKSPIALMTRNQISTWPMWKSDFHMTHGEIVAHFTENWSCGNQISAWAMWKSDFCMGHVEILKNVLILSFLLTLEATRI